MRALSSTMLRMKLFTIQPGLHKHKGVISKEWLKATQSDELFRSLQLEQPAQLPTGGALRRREEKDCFIVAPSILILRSGQLVNARYHQEF